jgi:hypothetical protein
VDISFDAAPETFQSSAVTEGGHKTARWRVALSPADATPLRAFIELRGRPRWFGLSLVQGYFVEPLLSIVAARSGHVLLPGAALAVEGTALVVMGRSGVGKSSLCARAISAGRQVLGDDQVLLHASARVWPFPRRMRVYPDLSRTAPAAYSLLSPRTRAALALRRVVRLLTRGYVAPSCAVDPSELGAAGLANSLDIGRIVVVERTGDDDLRTEEVGASLAVDDALALLEEQRARLRAVEDSGWAIAFRRTREHERATLQDALTGKPIERVLLPRAWEAPRAVEALAKRVGVES